MPPFLGFNPGEGSEGEAGFPWCKMTLVLTESSELFSCRCVGSLLCAVLEESPCCQRGQVALLRRGLRAEEGGPVSNCHPSCSFPRKPALTSCSHT